MPRNLVEPSFSCLIFWGVFCTSNRQTDERSSNMSSTFRILIGFLWFPHSSHSLPTRPSGLVQLYNLKRFFSVETSKCSKRSIRCITNHLHLIVSQFFSFFFNFIYLFFFGTPFINSLQSTQNLQRVYRMYSVHCTLYQIHKEFVPSLLEGIGKSARRTFRTKTKMRKIKIFIIRPLMD